MVPAHIAELLGKAPVLKSEDPKQYQALLSEIARTVKPADVMEWLWVKDIADLTWDILRYRRLKTSWIEAKRCEDSKVLDGFYVHWNAYGQLHLLEQMQASAELRRNNTLNEIESRRPDLKPLTDAIAGPTPDSCRWHFTNMAAEAEFELRRVRAARLTLIAPLVADLVETEDREADADRPGRAAILKSLTGSIATNADAIAHCDCFDQLHEFLLSFCYYNL